MHFKLDTVRLGIYVMPIPRVSLVLPTLLCYDYLYSLYSSSVVVLCLVLIPIHPYEMLTLLFVNSSLRSVWRILGCLFQIGLRYLEQREDSMLGHLKLSLSGSPIQFLIVVDWFSDVLMGLYFILGTGRYSIWFIFHPSLNSLALTFWTTSAIHILQIDESPLDGQVFDREALEELSKEGVTLVSLLISLPETFWED